MDIYILKLRWKKIAYIVNWMSIWFFFHFTEILDNLCKDFLEKNVTTIVYLTNSELFGRSTASSQYFLQLASYLGIPVIAWNADNSGLERRVSLFYKLFFLDWNDYFILFWFASYMTSYFSAFCQIS